MNIILCGLPMCGKTSIGKMLAEKLGWKFTDTDQLIESFYENKTNSIYSCREIFTKKGEVFFRLLEKKQIASLKDSTQSVIATGGGCFTDPANRKILQLLGTVIYLKTPLNILLKRMHLYGIPAYLDPQEPEKTLHNIAEKRTVFFEKAASIKIDTSDLNKEQIVTLILNNRKIKDGE